MTDFVDDDQVAVEEVRYLKDPEEAARKLSELAKSNWAEDNITVVVVRLRNPPCD